LEEPQNQPGQPVADNQSLPSRWEDPWIYVQVLVWLWPVIWLLINSYLFPLQFKPGYPLGHWVDPPGGIWKKVWLCALPGVWLCCAVASKPTRKYAGQAVIGWFLWLFVNFMLGAVTQGALSSALSKAFAGEDPVP
jgi:hypothetical protein